MTSCMRQVMGCIQSATKRPKKKVDEEQLQFTSISPVDHHSHPIRVMDFDKWKSYESIPRNPDISGASLDLKTIDSSNSLIIYISHVWIRASRRSEGWDGQRHPDNSKSDKYKLIVEGIERILKTFAPDLGISHQAE
eukprot:gene35943-46674_t